jgi:hypothetical protein
MYQYDGYFYFLVNGSYVLISGCCLPTSAGWHPGSGSLQGKMGQGNAQEHGEGCRDTA